MINGRIFRLGVMAVAIGASVMAIRIPRAWELPERLATPEHLSLNRRAVLAGAGALLPGLAIAQAIERLWATPRISACLPSNLPGMRRS